MQREKKRISGFWRTVIILIAAGLLICGAFWFPAVCDGFLDHVNPLLVRGIGAVTNALPFSVSEIATAAALLAAGISFILLILMLFLHRKTGYRKFFAGWFKTWAIIALLTGILSGAEMLLTVRSSVLGRKTAEREYTAEQLEALYNRMNAQVNAAIDAVPRDGDGHIVYPDEVHIRESIRTGIANVKAEFPRVFDGLPEMKQAVFSDVMEWLGAAAYTDFVSMEITVNKYQLADGLNAPAIYTHELAHYMGYMRESEANFLSYLICEKSGDPFLQYAGYYGIYVHGYMDQAMNEAWWGDLGGLPSMDEINARYGTLVQLDPRFDADVDYNIRRRMDVLGVEYVTDAHPLDAVSETISEIGEFHWEKQKAVLKEHDYDGVVWLLLEYYC